MDLLAFFSGICVASVGFFVISRILLKAAPPSPALLNELNRLHAKVDAIVKQPPPPFAPAAPPVTLSIPMHAKRAEVLADLYAKLVSLQRHLNEAHVLQTAEGRLYFGGREASERDIEQKLEREKASVFEEHQKLSEFVGAHRIYFDETMSDGLDPMLASFQQMIAQSITSGIFRRGSATLLTDNIAQVASAMRLVDSRFKELLGMEKRAAGGTASAKRDPAISASS